MSTNRQQMADALAAEFADKLETVSVAYDEVTIEVSAENLVEVATGLRDHDSFRFQQVVDICGVDYSQYGRSEWQTEDASGAGFSRGVDAATSGRLQFGDELDSLAVQGRRFAAVYHLISYAHNQRLRMRVYALDDSFPVVPTVS